MMPLSKTRNKSGTSIAWGVVGAKRTDGHWANNKIMVSIFIPILKYKKTLIISIKILNNFD